MKTVCRVLGVARSNVSIRATRPSGWTDRRRGRRPMEDTTLVEEIRREIADLNSYGYRRACALVNRGREASAERRVNPKRAYRVMREHGLLLQRHTGRPPDTRSHDGRIAVDRSNLRWCSDGFEIGCDNAERVRVAFALDCCDREAMSWVATTKGIDAELVGDLMMQAVEQRFGANGKAAGNVEWLTDNGSCYTAAKTRSFAQELGLKPVTTWMRSPQSNGMAESFVRTFKRDYADLAHRPDAQTVMRQLAGWFEHYNTQHPHSALGYLPPRRFKEKQAVNY